MESKNFWDTFSKNYAKNVLNKKNNEVKNNIKYLKNEFKIDKNTSILEIGPGPGTYTMPLAREVKEITVVEQSTGMIDILKNRMKEEEIDNINIINKRWDDFKLDADSNPDIVFSSYSLGVDDMESALKKMNNYAEKYCCILTFGTRQAWRPIYNKIGESILEHDPKRKEYGMTYILIYNILYQLGIYADVKISEKPFLQTFENLDEAAEHYLDRFRARGDIKLNNEQYSKIKEILSNELTKTEDSWKFEKNSKEALIWWKKEQNI
ncbi:methyltransferase domain-containing protein [Methanococcus maripaludis]|uniref:SAM (And some other nucleotide) binding motif n=1 Tax=Methanococcus maripaludis (strain DSM 14266 / JCM 13030 / NBRC 101832 / S2 / LL) TaxID=267377 RepID=Q6LYW1_METMP|nr:class I SAM-dependent methyltransferase [Methanococcus maripaludis]CAF30430.1 SAM (and some other nucleotide) binding motif [Methanococcus maripaludis S2]